MRNVYLIGNSHIDPVWLWRWQDGFSEIISTFRSALDRMKDFPDFKFTSACSVYYEWIEKADPEMFEEIRMRVKEGRWNIVGGWFLQPDCNIPCGESFARHSLISQRYFKDKFGITVKTGYNVDSFGHNAAIPKILKNSGISNYIFMRPDHNEKDLKKNLFYWESDDGSKVLAYRIPWFYNVNSKQLNLVSDLKEKCDADNLDYMLFYGIGNHGGGPSIKLIEELGNIDVPGLIFSTPDEYFVNVNTSEIDTIKDELQHHARGCYSSCNFAKKSNRECEQNLLAAEKLCVMAKELVGTEYPAPKFKKAWKNLLFNQFHDILAGCCIKQAYEDAGYLYGETMSITEQELNFAMQSIALKIDTLGDSTLPAYKINDWATWQHEVLGTPFVVFNPHSWEVSMPVSIFVAKAKKVTDCDGNEIPLQIVRGNYINGETKSLALFTATVPAYGYAVYRVFIEQESTETFEKDVFVTEYSLENDKIKVEFDKNSGEICSFYDKSTGKYVINKPCRTVLLDETHCDTWAHGVQTLGEVCGCFENPTFEIVEDGIVQCILRVTTTHENSVLVRDYTLSAASSSLIVNTKVNFSEKHKVLKFTFPMQEENITSQIAYGTITRPSNNGEDPCNMWISNGDMCIANNFTHGYDSQDGEIRLTALRGAIYADHFGQDHRDSSCDYMEQGESKFSYSIFCHTSNSDSDRKARELNFGLRVVQTSFHNGTLPEKMSCLDCKNENIIVTAIKENEDKNGNTVRFFEVDGIDSAVSLKLFNSEIKTDISHNKIKTFSDKGKELNLIEWDD